MTNANNSLKILPEPSTRHSGDPRKGTDKCVGYLWLHGKGVIWTGTEFSGPGSGIKAFKEAEAEAAKY